MLVAGAAKVLGSHYQSTRASAEGHRILICKGEPDEVCDKRLAREREVADRLKKQTAQCLDEYLVKRRDSDGWDACNNRAVAAAREQYAAIRTEYFGRDADQPTTKSTASP